MNNAKFHRDSFHILILTLFISLPGCRKKGPLGIELDRSRREFHRLEQIRDPEERKTTAHRLLESTGNLLSDRSYRDSADVRDRKDIMYQASILMAATAERIENRPLALQFYMNAYLMRPASALKDTKRMLPHGKHWKEYEEIRVPRYSVVAESRKDLPREDGAAIVTGAASNDASPFRLSLGVKTESALSSLMLQMIAGDILFQRRERSPGLTSMVIVYYMDSAVAPGAPDSESESESAPAIGYASAFWDSESDHITIQLNPTGPGQM